MCEGEGRIERVPAIGFTLVTFGLANLFYEGFKPCKTCRATGYVLTEMPDETV